jgi:hypothetical protein
MGLVFMFVMGGHFFLLFWNMPLLFTALPIPLLVGIRFLLPRARLWASGLLLGALLSFALHIVIILSLGTQLYRWYQITTVY